MNAVLKGRILDLQTQVNILRNKRKLDLKNYKEMQEAAGRYCNRVGELEKDIKFLLSFSPFYKSVEDKIADIKERLEK